MSTGCDGTEKLLQTGQIWTQEHQINRSAVPHTGCVDSYTEQKDRPPRRGQPLNKGQNRSNV